MSWLTLPAVVAVGLVGAFVVALLEQAVAGRRPAPVAVLGRGLALVRQPIAMPRVKDDFLYHSAPFVLLVSAVLALAMVPWAPGFRGVDFPVGALVFAAVLAYVAPAVMMAGWGSGRPFSILAGFRFVAVLLAWEMPLVMAITAVAAPAGSLRPSAIVEVQHAVPLLASQPLAFLLFVPSVLAVAFVAPFDLPQAPGELGGGAFSQYTGLHAAAIALAQRILVVAAAGMTAALFLGGWEWGGLPPGLWMALKTLVIATAVLWAGRRLPRVEIDRVLPVVWKFAVPGAIVAIAWAALITRIFYAS